jgi:hypothetical protein
MGRLLRVGVLAVGFAIIALAGATGAFAVEPVDPPVNTGDYRVFPICRPGPTCGKGPVILTNDQFVDDKEIRLGFPLYVWILSTVTTDQPPNELPAPVDPVHHYCFATAQGPDRANVIQITTVFGDTFVTPVGPSKHLCVPDNKTELN